MNIHDFWPSDPEPIKSTPEVWSRLLEMRRQTFMGFAAVEAMHQGVVKPKVSFASVQGQEAIRMLCFRTLEELGEAYLSKDKDHYYEELIDAFNYLLSLFFLEGHQPRGLEGELHNLSRQLCSEPDRMTLEWLGEVTVDLGGEMGDYLRNRPWMKNAQSTYFDGDLIGLLSKTLQDIMFLFPSFDLFYRYYVAKDSTLQFRLRSNY